LELEVPLDKTEMILFLILLLQLAAAPEQVMYQPEMNLEVTVALVEEQEIILQEQV